MLTYKLTVLYLAPEVSLRPAKWSGSESVDAGSGYIQGTRHARPHAIKLANLGRLSRAALAPWAEPVRQELPGSRCTILLC
jgi:hypothetical protein